MQKRIEEDRSILLFGGLNATQYDVREPLNPLARAHILDNNALCAIT
jgi:hypothetical protein